MPRARNPENKGLPSRWQIDHGSYYYHVPPGMEAYWDNKKKFRLGKTLSEAYRVWADRLGSLDDIRNIGGLLDRYALEVVPEKAIKTQRENARQIVRLKKVFGHLPLSAIEPQHIYKYIDKSAAKISARREIAVLSHAYTKAVEWGQIKAHPFKNEVRLKGEKPRTRYIEDWEILECLALQPLRKEGSVRMIQCYITLKLLTGLRRQDMLGLKISDLKEDGIHVLTKKTGKAVIYQWSPALKKAVDAAKDARPVDISPFLFCTIRGKGYINKDGDAHGWNSMWQRFMERVLSETKITERFTEHDLRAKCASDAKTLEHAQQLLAHTDSKITQRVYRRKADLIAPTKLDLNSAKRPE